MNTYIICPAGVNGAGWGPVSKVTIYIKYFVGAVLQQKSVFKVGEGSNVFGFVSAWLSSLWIDVNFKLLRYISKILLRSTSTSSGVR